jgi:ubiquinone/menaquinone biosynthesis C-methylase UbiE
MPNPITAGDFTELAKDYSLHRPDYSHSVLKAMTGLSPKKFSDIDFVDIGAGTGIWSRMVYEEGVKSLIAIELNSAMRQKGIEDSRNMSIQWINGCAEKSTLPAKSADWVSMASSFHWANFGLATCEFHRILRPGGLFTALWNPRLLETNPILLDIEEHLKTLRPDIQRVSSGRSGITNSLCDNLLRSSYFEDVIYVEGRHQIQMTPSRYIGAWKSVNDLRVQLGPDKFNLFLSYVEKKVSGITTINATYLTRAWTARRKD